MKTKAIVIALALALATTGCATPNMGGADDNNTALKCGLMATGGAVLGGLVDGKRGVVRGALLGLAACAVIEVASARTQSAAEVEQKYRSANRNALPPSAKVVNYASAVSPQGQARSGDPIKVQSKIRAVAGTGEAIREIKEVLVAFDPEGKEFKRGEKLVDTSGGSGEFTNNFTLRLPQSAPEGNYRLHTDVYLNGKLASSSDASLQLVKAGEQRVVSSL